MNIKRLIVCITVLLVAVVLGCTSNVAAAESESTAENIAKKCKYTFSSNSSKKSKLIDGDLSTLYFCEKSGKQYIEIDLNGNPAQCLYIKWKKPCSCWQLSVDTGDGFGDAEMRGKYSLVQEYAELPEGTVRVRISTEDAATAPLEILDLYIYGNGKLPGSVHKWQPTPGTAELMVVSTHQDDELLFFGGTIPYYSGELGLDTLVVYMAYDNGLRLHEALEGLWLCGHRQNPVFLCYPDKYCTSLDGAKRYWNEDNVSKSLTRLIAQYRPQVIVTHDENGEYGHGQHMLTVKCVKNAIKNAADSDYMSASFPSLDTYSVPKCYLHLYGKSKVVMPWDKLNLGGKSSLEAAQKAFKQHTSQWSTGFRVRMSGRNNCSKFGLYHTTVGKDTKCNDFFENITLRITDIPVPESAVTADFSKSEEIEKLYIYTNPVNGECQPVRYGTVSGSDGWYLADETGAVALPVSRLTVFSDRIAEGITFYETLSASDISALIYSYRETPDAYASLVRYGEWNGVCGWFEVDESGNVLNDSPMEIRKNYPVETPASPEASSSDITVSKYDGDILLFVILGVAVIIAVLTAIFAVSRRKRRSLDFVGKTD